MTEKNVIIIDIYFDCPARLWQEEKQLTEPPTSGNLEKVRDFIHEIGLSPKMKLLLSQTLLETMGGSLELFDSYSKTSQEPITRISITCQQTNK